MDQATQTMIENLKKNTGKTLEQWITIVHKTKLEKHGEIVKCLKEEHGFGHGYANLVSMMARELRDGIPYAMMRAPTPYESRDSLWQIKQPC